MGGFNNPDIAREAGKKSKAGKHEKTKQWEALGELITGKLTERVLQYIDSLPPDKMFERYLDLLEYFKPKLSRSEVRAEMTDMNTKRSTVFDEMESEPDLSGSQTP